MANAMTTYVKVGNLNEETHKKFVELFEKSNDQVSHFNTLYGTDFEDLGSLERDWMLENVGTKWMEVDCEDLEYSDTMELVLETAWSVPTEYLQKIVEFIGGDVVVYGTYEDEAYDPIGAFVYAVDYDDIEDYEEVEHEKMFQDDDYMEEMYDGLYELRDSLYEGYREVMDERKLEE
jgi:hypothetical protein